MTTGLIATADPRTSNTLKHEYMPDIGYCRDVVNAYEASAKTYKSGATVLGKTFVATSATATAASGNTGNGAMGTVTVSGKGRPGKYTVTITAAASNAGDFVVRDPDGAVIGNGTVGVAHFNGQLLFSLADGSTDFAVGDSFTIVVVGSYRYKRVEDSAIDGSDVACAIYLAQNDVGFANASISANTSTPILAIVRGPVAVARESLDYGSSINTTAEKNALYAQLEAVGIATYTQV